MRVLVLGTTGNLGQAILPLLKEMNHVVISAGRSHHPLADQKIAWNLGCKLDLPEDIDFILYLAFSYESIKSGSDFREINLKSFEELAKIPDIARRLIIPLSHSGRLGVKSLYGKVKYEQAVLAKAFGVRTITLGWLKSDSNGGAITQGVIKFLSKLRINILPKSGTQTIYLSTPRDISKSLSEVFSGSKSSMAYNPIGTTLKELVSPKATIRLYGISVALKSLLMVLPLMYILLPAKIVRSIDSARTLI
jgi:hypothetical protein